MSLTSFKINPQLDLEQQYDDYEKEMLIENPDEDEQYLIHKQLKRKETLDEYKEFIDEMVSPLKKKQKTYRRDLIVFLNYGSRVIFKTEDAEYEYIGKFGRGIWSEDLIKKAFNKKEQEIIFKIADGFGALDY
jgi:hypothetical protein